MPDSQGTVREVVVKRNTCTKDYGSVSLREYDAMRRLRGHPLFVNMLKILHTNQICFTQSSSMSSEEQHNRQLLMEFNEDDKYYDDWHLILEKVSPLHKIVTTDQHHGLIMAQLLYAIDYLHNQQGMTHRDLSIANVLVDVVNNLPVIKINDFGMVCVNYGLSMTSKKLCTPTYQAPELFDPVYKTYTSKVDEWSVGCIFFYLITNSELIIVNDKAKIDEDYVNQIQSLEPKFQLLRRRCNDKYGQRADKIYNIVTGLLQVDPNNRITCAQAIESAFMTEEEAGQLRNILSTSVAKSYDSILHPIPPSQCKQMAYVNKWLYECREKIPYSILETTCDIFNRYCNERIRQGKHNQPNDVSYEQNVSRFVSLLYLSDMLHSPFGTNTTLVKYNVIIDDQVRVTNVFFDSFVKYIIFKYFAVLINKTPLVTYRSTYDMTNQQCVDFLINSYTAQ
jgi:serine/threonine protein kinase